MYYSLHNYSEVYFIHMLLATILAIDRPKIVKTWYPLNRINLKSKFDILEDEGGTVRVLSNDKEKPNCFYMDTQEQCKDEYQNKISTCYSYKDLMPSLKATQLTEVYIAFAGTNDQLFPTISGDLPLKIHIQHGKNHFKLGETQHAFFYISNQIIHSSSQTLNCETVSLYLKDVTFVGVDTLHLKILDSNLQSFAGVANVILTENLKISDLKSAQGNFPFFQPASSDVIIEIQDISPFNEINHQKDKLCFSHSSATFSLGINSQQKIILTTTDQNVELSSDIQNIEEAKINFECCYIMLKKETTVRMKSEHWYFPIRTNSKLTLNFEKPSIEMAEIKQITSNPIEMYTSLQSISTININSLILLGKLCIGNSFIQLQVKELNAMHDEINSQLKIGTNSISTISIDKLTSSVKKFNADISLEFDSASDETLENVMKQNWELFGAQEGSVDEIAYTINVPQWIHGFSGQLCYEIMAVGKLYLMWTSKINDIPVCFSTVEKEGFLKLSRDEFIGKMSSQQSGINNLLFFISEDYTDPITISGLYPTNLKIFSEQSVRKINIIGTIKVSSLTLEYVDVISTSDLIILSSSLKLDKVTSSNNAPIKVTSNGCSIDADLKTLSLLKSAIKPKLNFNDKITHLKFTQSGLVISDNVNQFEIQDCENLHQKIKFDPFNEVYFSVEGTTKIPLTCVDLSPIESIENAPFVVKGDIFNSVDYKGELEIDGIKYIRYETDNTANVPPLKIPFNVQITNQKDDILSVKTAGVFSESNRFPYSFSESSPKAAMEFPEIKIGDRSMSTFEPKDIEIHSANIKVNITEVPKVKLFPSLLLEVGPLRNCPPLEAKEKISLAIRYSKDGLPVIPYLPNGLKALTLVTDDDHINILEYDQMFSQKQRVFEDLPKSDCEEIAKMAKVVSSEPTYSSTSPSYRLALWCITSHKNQTSLYFGSRSEVPLPTQSVDPRPYFTSPPEESLIKKLMKGVAIFSFVGTVILTATACYFGGCIGSRHRLRKAGTPNYNTEGVEDSMSSLSMVDGLNVDSMRAFKFIDTTVFQDVE